MKSRREGVKSVSGVCKMTPVVRACLDGLTRGHLGMFAEFIRVNVPDLIYGRGPACHQDG